MFNFKKTTYNSLGFVKKIRNRLFYFLLIKITFLFVIRHPANETLESKISFQNIVIKGMFPLKQAINMPTTLNFNVSPYPTTDFAYRESTNQQ